MNHRAISYLSMLGVLGLVLWLLSGARRTGDGVAGSPTPTRSANLLTALQRSTADSPAPRARVAIRAVEPPERETDPYEAWDTEVILDHFGVPPGKFEGASMAEVVAFLQQLYAEHGGKNIEFRIDGSGGFPIQMDYGNVSAMGLMQAVAGLGGYELEVGERLVVFRRKPPIGGGLQNLRLNGKMVLERDGGPFGETVDSRPAAERAVEFFASYGLDFGEGIEVDAETGEWLLSAPGADNDRALAAYQFFLDQPNPGHVHIDAKSVTSTEGASLDAQTFGEDAEFGAAIQEFGQSAGTSLTTTPTLTMSAGQRAKFEVIRELIYPFQWDAGGNPTAFDTVNLGMSMELRPIVLGLDRIELEGEFELIAADGQSLTEVLGGDYPDHRQEWREEDFRSVGTEFAGQLFDGTTTTFVGAAEGQESVQQFISVRRVGQDGQRLLPQ